MFLLFQIGCDSSDKKVYKKFDTAKSYFETSKSLSDSKEDGGYGFENIALLKNDKLILVHLGAQYNDLKARNLALG